MNLQLAEIATNHRISIMNAQQKIVIVLTENVYTLTCRMKLNKIEMKNKGFKSMDNNSKKSYFPSLSCSLFPLFRNLSKLVSLSCNRSTKAKTDQFIF